MKNKKILSLFLSCICVFGIACSGNQKSFCIVQSTHSGDAIIKGVVIGSSTNAIQLLVMEVLRGSETRSVVSIWDASTISCGYHSFTQKAIDIAAQGDTILAVLPKITSVQHTWDVIGDHRRPYSLFWTPVLRIKKDTLRGYIVGNYHNFELNYWGIYKMSYSDFKSGWKNNTVCSANVGIEEARSLTQPLISQNGTEIQISFGAIDIKSTVVSPMGGSVIAEFKGSHQIDLNIENYPAGMYLLTITSVEGKRFCYKIVR
jgi:hypothetical protein